MSNTMSSPKKKQATPTREDLIRRAEIELDGDTFTLRASERYRVPPEKVTPKQRELVKESRFSFAVAIEDNRMHFAVLQEASNDTD